MDLHLLQRKHSEFQLEQEWSVEKVALGVVQFYKTCNRGLSVKRLDKLDKLDNTG